MKKILFKQDKSNKEYLDEIYSIAINELNKTKEDFKITKL